MNSTMWLRALAAAWALGGTGALNAQVLNGEHVAPGARMEKAISLPVRSAGLRDAFAAFEAASGLRLNPAWIDEDHAEGLDPEQTIDLDARPRPAVRLLETILEKAHASATWQMDADGAIEVGPRSRLNEHRTIRLYPVRDLLTAIPDYTDAPTIDLQAALQAHSTSPLREPGAERPPAAEQRPAQVNELVSLITSTIEPEQWTDSGGSGATIRLYRDALIVNAPGYIHRQLAGR
jgi:hypothetical protein